MDIYFSAFWIGLCGFGRICEPKAVLSHISPFHGWSDLGWCGDPEAGNEFSGA
jgi:hypothetical protein